MRTFELFCAEGDGVSVLVEFEGNEIVNTISGDYYHNKVSHYIEGYLEGISEFDRVDVTEFCIDIDEESDFDWQEERKKEAKETYILGENNF